VAASRPATPARHGGTKRTEEVRGPERSPSWPRWVFTSAPGLYDRGGAASRSSGSRATAHRRRRRLELSRSPEAPLVASHRPLWTGSPRPRPAGAGEQRLLSHGASAGLAAQPRSSPSPGPDSCCKCTVHSTGQVRLLSFSFQIFNVIVTSSQ
jgi:hypothetical protein